MELLIFLKFSGYNTPKAPRFARWIWYIPIIPIFLFLLTFTKADIGGAPISDHPPNEMQIQDETIPGIRAFFPVKNTFLFAIVVGQLMIACFLTTEDTTNWYSNFHFHIWFFCLVMKQIKTLKIAQRVFELNKLCIFLVCFVWILHVFSGGWEKNLTACVLVGSLLLDYYILCCCCFFQKKIIENRKCDNTIFSSAQHKTTFLSWLKTNYSRHGTVFKLSVNKNLPVCTLDGELWYPYHFGVVADSFV